MDALSVLTNLNVSAADEKGGSSRSFARENESAGEYSDYQKNVEYSFAPRQISNVIEQMEDNPALSGRFLKFDIDHETSELVISIVDANTGQKIRQIPDETVIQMMLNSDQITGLLVDEHF